MKHLKLAQRNKEVNPTSWTTLYQNNVVRKLRKDRKISLYNELKIHREALVLLAEIVKKLHNEEIDTRELDALNEAVELCKSEAKSEMNIS